MSYDRFGGLRKDILAVTDLGDRDPSHAAPVISFEENVVKFVNSSSFRAALPAGSEVSGLHLIRKMGSYVFKGNLRSVAGTPPIEIAFKISNPEQFTNLSQNGSPLERQAKQLWCAEQFRTRGIPTPQTLVAGTVEIGFQECPWQIETWTTGEAPSKSHIERLENNQLWEVTGEVIHRIVSIPTAGFGSRFDVATGTFRQKWKDCVDQMVDRCQLEKLRSEGFFSDEESEKLLKKFQSIYSLDQCYSPCLNHLDLSPYNNMLFKPASLRPGEKASVNAVLDFDTAASMPGAVFEIAGVKLRESLFGQDTTHSFPAFLKGMGIDPNNYRGSPLERNVNSVVILQAVGWCPFLLSSDGFFPDGLPSIRRLLVSEGVLTSV